MRERIEQKSENINSNYEGRLMKPFFFYETMRIASTLLSKAVPHFPKGA